LRRFAPEVYVSGFRVEPAMTSVFFASPGALQETDVRRQETEILAALCAGEMGGGTQGRRLGCSEAETQRSRTSPGDGESTPGENPKTSSFRT
jgi:hypothetical protein